MHSNTELITFDLSLLGNPEYELVFKTKDNPPEVVDWAAHDPTNPRDNCRIVTRTGRDHLFHREDGRWLEGGPVMLFHRRKADPDPVDPSPGNTYKLRRSQVGDGWRIPTHDEPIDSRAEWWSRGDQKWVPRSNAQQGIPYNPRSTYRVPIDPPKPKTKTVPLTAADIPLGAWIRPSGHESREVMVTERVHGRSNVIVVSGKVWSLEEYADERPDATISLDGGGTWRPMTKEVPCE